ncbi:hypothetical protein JG687_00010531 [Phytophthora cactorum]|uniref:Uncharacterized protein n=1 Tax=Phytophthora cactorum TaxID=29920 RepID=A0A8T1U9A7_9STRA|nr:hypothetical protein JG687_00010531 [Phytophthora cactorum]
MLSYNYEVRLTIICGSVFFCVNVQRVLWAAKAVATPTKTDEEALVMAVDEASVVALYVAVAGVVMTMHELLTQ